MVDLIEFRMFGSYTLPADVVLKRPDTYRTSQGIVGTLDSMKVQLTQEHVTVRGSLPKFLRGNNIEPMTVSDTAEAIQRLEGRLGFAIQDGRLRQLEIGTAIPVDCPSPWYTSTWGPLSRFERVTFGNGGTVLYRTRPRSIQGYDKEAESSRKLHQVPEAYRDLHLIRLEYKLICDIAETFGRPLFIRDLLDADVVHELMNDWLHFYFAIKKYPKTFVAVNGKKRDLYNSLVAFGVDCLGGLENLTLNIKGRADLSLDQRQGWIRDLVRITQHPVYTRTSELTAELDEKVQQMLVACW